MRDWIADECRKRVVEDLEQMGLMEKIEDYCPQCRHLLPLPYDGGTHHFRAVVRQDGAAGQSPLCEVVKDGEVKFVPERFSKTYSELDGERPRLVHLPSALVGASESRRGTAPTAAR